MAVLVLVPLPCRAGSDSSSPIQQVIQLLTKLQGEVIEDGNADQATYDKFTLWCGTRSSELLHEIEEAKLTKLATEAKIEKAETQASEASSEVQKLVVSTATSGADLKAIKLIREKERKDFEQLDLELTNTLRILEKAQKALEQPTSSSFLQRPTQGMKVFLALIGQLVDAEHMISEADRGRLMVLLQDQAGTSASDSEQADEDIEDDAEEDGQQTQSPSDGQTYTTVSSSDIPRLIKEMQDKTEESQREVRKKELDERHNYEMFKARLEDRLNIENKELDAAKKAAASALEVKATSEGTLEQIKKDLQGDEEDLQTTQHNCMARAQEFKIETEDRGQELEALTAAKKTIQQSMFLQKPYSFLQVNSKAKAAHRGTLGIATAKVLRQVKQLAKDQKSEALMQLSSRITAVLRYSAASGADPFAKVKELIEAMITRLEGEMQEEEAQKTMCDKEMPETEASKAEHEGDIEALTTQLEKKTNEASKLRQEVAMFSEEIADLVKSKAELDAIRSQEHEAYVKATTDLHEGFVAVQAALKILREYYNKPDSGLSLLQDMGKSMRTVSKGPGGGKGIIALLEVIEADISTSLAEAETAEDSAKEEYQKTELENTEAQKKKEVVIKAKTAEATALDKVAAEIRGDRQEKEQELDAIIEYYEKLKPECVQPPETFEERQEKRQRTIDGLQQALELLA